MFLIFAFIVAAVAAAAGAAAAASEAADAQAEVARTNAAAARRAAEQAADAQRKAAQPGAGGCAPAFVISIIRILRKALHRAGSRRILLTGMVLSLALLRLHFVIGVNPPRAAGDPDLGVVPTPSATATSTPTPQPTQTSAPSPTPAPAALTMSQNANCRKGPGVAYNILTSFAQGTEWIAIGRNAESTWWKVAVPEGEACWLGDASVEKSGPLDALPMLVGPQLPESPYVFYDETICTKKVYKVTLYWQDVSDEVGYHIYRNGVFLDAVERNRTKFINYAPFGQDLVYELESFNENGVSERLDTTVLACTK